MANIALFREGKTPEYLLAVDTSLYIDDPEALVNPDVTAVIDLDWKYWKRVDDTIQEMTQVEKDGVLAAEAAAIVASNDALAEALTIGGDILAQALIASGLISRDELVMAVKGVLNG